MFSHKMMNSAHLDEFQTPHTLLFLYIMYVIHIGHYTQSDCVGIFIM